PTRNIPTPENTERIIKLYPNPAQSYITFDIQKSSEKGLSIQVFNFLGKKMYESQKINEKLTVDLAEFNRGVYIYHLRDLNGKIIESGKFQVSR
ncbi:MAG: T9SS type A sorting domain-containing protein, partial [Bacteroidia bacterium]|nr:T9SS type A sorting domain-containing protein [Bacteroidia bacterium]